MDNTATLNALFRAHGVGARVIRETAGPTTLLYRVALDSGTRPQSVTALRDTIVVALGLDSVTVKTPVHKEPVMGIEIPRADRQVVTLDDVPVGASSHPLTVPLGLDTAGTARTANLATLPHLLVAGATGSGKSVYLNDLLITLITTTGPEVVRLVLIDPKRVELRPYERVPHLWCPVASTAQSAVDTLSAVIAEMEQRYERLEAAEARGIDEYNASVDEAETLPYLVVVVDELASLMLTVRKQAEPLLARLAGEARAAGIHLVLGTQRPSVDVVTGLIKSNVPGRLVFAVADHVASKVALDKTGAQDLTGAGDGLYMGTGVGQPLRVQTPYSTREDVARAVATARAEYPDMTYLWETKPAREPATPTTPPSSVARYRPAARTTQSKETEDTDTSVDKSAVVKIAALAGAAALFLVVLIVGLVEGSPGQPPQPSPYATVPAPTPTFPPLPTGTYVVTVPPTP